MYDNVYIYIIEGVVDVGKEYYNEPTSGVRPEGAYIYGICRYLIQPWAKLPFSMFRLPLYICITIILCNKRAYIIILDVCVYIIVFYIRCVFAPWHGIKTHYDIILYYIYVETKKTFFLFRTPRALFVIRAYRIWLIKGRSLRKGSFICFLRIYIHIFIHIYVYMYMSLRGRRATVAKELIFVSQSRGNPCV